MSSLGISNKRRAHRPDRCGTPLRGLFTSGRSPHVRIYVGPTVRIAAVHRFAASLLPVGPPTSVFTSGPPSGSLRYTASRPLYFRSVPPRPSLFKADSGYVRISANEESPGLVPILTGVIDADSGTRIDGPGL